MNYLRKIFPVGHFVISLLFVVSAAALIALAGIQIWSGIHLFAQSSLSERLNSVLEAIALLTVAVAALELAQTILEEEVLREAHMSAPTRVRRFLSRFMVVLVVSLSIETVVLTFRFSQDHPEYLPYVASIGMTAALLLVAWGVFIRLNRAAEELEPEAMAEAKKEDRKVEKPWQSPVTIRAQSCRRPSSTAIPSTSPASWRRTSTRTSRGRPAMCSPTSTACSPSAARASRRSCRPPSGSPTSATARR
jgi:hypothetical protein